jgi:hypothetical protein
MRRAARRLVLPFAALLACAPLTVAGLEWPVARRVVTATFGEDRADHFHNGIDIGGGEQDVHPVLPGELVFGYEENSDYTSLPRGVGSFVVLHHGDDIESVYCHLKNGTVDAGRAVYGPSDRIGIMGDTGYSEGTHLHLIVRDEEGASYVNPLSLLPPLADAQAPVIRRVALAVGDRIHPLAPGSLVPAGRGAVLAEIYDPRADVKFLWPMAPYSVRLSVDGKEVSKISFDALHTVEGRTVLRGTRLAATEVYAPDGLVRCGEIDLRPGTSHLLLTARDFAGNETSRELSFTVRD